MAVIRDKIVIVISAIISAVFGSLAASLGRYKETTSTREFLSKLRKEPYFPLIIYYCVIGVWMLLTLVTTPFRAAQLTNLLTREVQYAAVHEAWYMIFISFVMIFILAYPCLTLSRLSRLSTDEKVKRSLKIFATCLILSTISPPLLSFIRQYGYSEYELTYLFQTVLLGAMWYGFKQPTIFSKFFETPHYSMLPVGAGDHIVAFYTSKSDKMKVFSAYIHEGLVNGDKVVYVFPDSETELVERALREYGVDVKRHVKDGSLTLLSTSEWYLGGIYNSETVSQNMVKEIENAKENGYKHLRTIVDYGDVYQVFKDTEPFFDELRKAVGRIAQPYLITLRTFNLEALSEEEIQWLKEYNVRNLFICESFSVEMLDKFSRRLGLRHEELAGKKILFEFDATSNYEAAVEDFVFEGRANGELIVVFTHRGSGIHPDLAKQRGLKFFYLTSQVSVPRVGASENEILLPVNDVSLLLDAFNNTVKTNPRGNISIVFDSLSDLMLSVGFEKVYSFVRYALEMLTLGRVTALFLLSPDAHDLEVVSSLRGLFNNQVAYGNKELQPILLR